MATETKVTLQPEQIEKLIELLEEGKETLECRTQLSAHLHQNMPAMNSALAQKVYEALGDAFDELNAEFSSITQAIPLIRESIQKDMAPAQAKAKELINAFYQLSDLPRGEKGKAQLAFHGTMSRAMEPVLNTIGAKWGVPHFTVDWCDMQVSMLSKNIPGAVKPTEHLFGKEFCQLLRPARLSELEARKFDNIEIRTYILEQREALKDLFKLRERENVFNITS